MNELTRIRQTEIQHIRSMVQNHEATIFLGLMCLSTRCATWILRQQTQEKNNRSTLNYVC